MRSVLRRCFPLALVLALLGCVTTQKAGPPTLPAPLYEPLPVKVGIWYGELVYAHRSRGTLAGQFAGDYDIDFGNTHLVVLQQTFAATFADVVTLAERPSGPTADPSLDLVLLADVHWTQPGPQTEVKYRLVFRRPDGSDLTTYMAQGKATDFVAGDRRMAAALRDAAASIMVRLSENEELGKWIAQRGKRRPPLLQPPAANPRPHYVVMPERLANRDNENWADCMEGSIGRNQSAAASIPVPVLQDALFPWLEYSTKPSYDSDLIELLTRPLIRGRLNSLGLRYVVLTGGGSLGTAYPGLACPFINCFGGTPGSLGSQNAATAIDLRPAGALQQPAVIGQQAASGGCGGLGARMAEIIAAADRR